MSSRVQRVTAFSVTKAFVYYFNRELVSIFYNTGASQFSMLYCIRQENGSNDGFLFSGPLLQLMYGCQLRENGTSSGLYHFSVNGEYGLSMDMESPQWLSYLPQDLDIKNILDRFDLWNHNNLIYIHRDCVPRLKKFYKHSRTILDQQGKCVCACLNASSAICIASNKVISMLISRFNI